MQYDDSTLALMEEVAREFGATSFFYDESGYVSGLVFKEIPEKGWKYIDDHDKMGYMCLPDKRSSDGKRFSETVDGVNVYE